MAAGCAREPVRTVTSTDLLRGKAEPGTERLFLSLATGPGADNMLGNMPGISPGRSVPF